MRLTGCALTCVLGLTALLGCPHPAAASVAAPSLAALALRADRIVVSEVIEVRCERDAGRADNVPVTLVTVRVSRVLKGAASSHLVLEFLGGSIGEDTLDLLEIPRFAVGDRDVLFLSGRPRGVSPLLGVMHGRFRLIQSSESGEDVAAHDGTPLAEADLAGDALGRPLAVASSRPVSLATFEKQVLAIVARGTDADKGLKPRAQTATDEGLEPRATAGLRVEVNLGPSPALLDGCGDWSCALEAKGWFRGVSAGTGEADSGRVPVLERVSLEWAHSLFGRVLDVDTAALSILRTTSGSSSARVVFNQQLAWNSYGRNTAPANGPLDLPSVAGRELSLVANALEAAASSAAGLTPPASGGDRSRAAARRAPLSRAASPAEWTDLAASACGPDDVFVDPRLLVFQSPDHALMTGYQVGFFQPGAASPAQVVDVPLTAFLIRRAVDLPAWAAQAMQTSLVADIRTAGLATPIGLVCTYRVRGVWAGGTTAWSDSSQPFVRCSASATVTR